MSVSAALFLLFSLSHQAEVDARRFSTICQDGASPNTGFCTLENPIDTAHQVCQDSSSMQTCDGEG